MERITCITLALLLCIIANCLILYRDFIFNRKLNKRKISFKEALDLTELPIITLYQGEKKFNFLLDTGSNDSLISKPASRLIKGTYVKCNRTIEGLGTVDVNKICMTTLQYKNMEFEAECLVSDGITATFESIKKTCGVHIHGILGTKFFQKYKYVLDFDELVAYKK